MTNQKDLWNKIRFKKSKNKKFGGAKKYGSYSRNRLA